MRAMAGSVAAGHAAQASPQGNVDNRMRAPGSGYHGGPTATSAKGPPADLNAGQVAPPKPTSHQGHNVNLKI
jgi:hypothetical protein